MKEAEKKRKEKKRRGWGGFGGKKKEESRLELSNCGWRTENERNDLLLSLKGNQLPLSLSTTLNFQFLYSVTLLLINLKKKKENYEKLNLITSKLLTVFEKLSPNSFDLKRAIFDFD